jgi:hypothetical protein
MIDYSQRHLRVGWWSLLVFAILGLTLEALHGFKVRAYLDTSNETRRLMWTLAHAHGIGLALVHIVFGVMLRAVPDAAPRNVSLTSTALVLAGVLLPGGFFLGGVGFYAGDPGIGIALVPAGAAALLFAVFSIARGVTVRLTADTTHKGESRRDRRS